MNNAKAQCLIFFVFILQLAPVLMLYAAAFFMLSKSSSLPEQIFIPGAAILLSFLYVKALSRFFNFLHDRQEKKLKNEFFEFLETLPPQERIKWEAVNEIQKEIWNSDHEKKWKCPWCENLLKIEFPKRDMAKQHYIILLKCAGCGFQSVDISCKIPAWLKAHHDQSL